MAKEVVLPLRVDDIQHDDALHRAHRLCTYFVLFRRVFDLQLPQIASVISSELCLSKSIFSLSTSKS